MAHGACGASYTVRGRKLIGGKINTWYGCVAYAEHGTSVCAQRETLSATRASAALVARLRELLDTPASIAAFVRAGLVRCGLKLRVVPRPQNGRRFLLVGSPRPRQHRRRWLDARRFELAFAA